MSASIKKLRERWARWMRPPRRLIPTRAGLFTLGAPLILGIAAINAGNNLLFLLLGASLGLIVLSGLASERMISRLEADLGAAGPAYAGEAARLWVRIVKSSDGPAFAVGLREWRSMGRRVKGPRLDVWIPVIDGSGGSAIAERVFVDRGRATLGRLELVTKYPFGLFVKARDVDLECTIVVRARRVPVPEGLVDPRGLAVEGPRADRRGAGPDLYGLREWDGREPPRRIHALRSARLQRDVVVETEATSRPVAHLAIANVAGADRVAFERTIEIAQATLIEWDQRGFALALRTASGAIGPASLDSLLDTLATLELEPRMNDTEMSGALWLVPSGARPHEDARDGVVVHVDLQGNLQFEGAREEAA